MPRKSKEPAQKNFFEDHAKVVEALNPYEVENRNHAQEKKEPAQKNFFEDHAKVVEALNPYEVENWTVEEVCTQFLDKLGLGPLKQIFIDHKITGHVLMTLNKADLVEMRIHTVGDRVYIDRCLVELRRRWRKMERERTLWEGSTPSGGIAYFGSLTECCLYKLFPCFMQFTDWKVSSQGVRRRLNPPSCNCCCKSLHNDFSDFRFLKDVDWYKAPMCFCCKNATWVELSFDSKSEFSLGTETVTKDASNKLVCTKIMHPQMTEETTTRIRNAW
eukprot:CAMPEP_0206314734 /NCGR_PEP_ID=MMETSP0106_2-20121207/15171_1 /ASSEMBLY_ACC=CAM_ASM_000206 /TAXON_ID=81532 /ORGANISM="Acanthoeca-like sp., Strain 10tr" /LENGTH=273 /DNA_ID=CAMNT_0053746101 /DNA_START=33 /DNA_END=852 /DNA_ORIENTATION=+